MREIGLRAEGVSKIEACSRSYDGPYHQPLVSRLPNPLLAMKFDRLVVLLPCQSLEDFDLQRQEEDAEQLLVGMVGLVAPAAAGRAPGNSPLAAGDSPSFGSRRAI